MAPFNKTSCNTYLIFSSENTRVVSMLLVIVFLFLLSTVSFLVMEWQASVVVAVTFHIIVFGIMIQVGNVIHSLLNKTSIPTSALHILLASMSGKKILNTVRRKIVCSDNESDIEIVEMLSSPSKKKHGYIAVEMPSCFCDSTAWDPGLPATSSCLSLAVSTSGNLPIFGSQSSSLSHPSNSAADPIKDLTSRGAKKASSKINVDKQSTSCPECTKIKTEKALYADTEVVVQMPAIKRKAKNGLYNVCIVSDC
ncbi:hypothetical protein L208DRAFT_1382779 [Tricholoma matsutake]|nr:hypothetical protein L208DRAFT_1382779 [Tricholoma matsutake 945]